MNPLVTLQLESKAVGNDRVGRRLDEEDHPGGVNCRATSDFARSSISRGLLTQDIHPLGLPGSGTPFLRDYSQQEGPVPQSLLFLRLPQVVPRLAVPSPLLP